MDELSRVKLSSLLQGCPIESTRATLSSPACCDRLGEAIDPLVSAAEQSVKCISAD